MRLDGVDGRSRKWGAEVQGCRACTSGPKQTRCLFLEKVLQSGRAVITYRLAEGMDNI